MQFYGLLSNGVTSALVGPDASVDFLPLPRFDSPTVFTRLLGGEAEGYYRVGLADGEAEVSQAYLPGTNVLETWIRGAQGNVRIVDYLSVGRPELRRLVEATAPVRVEVRPVFGYGLVAAAPRANGAGAIFANPLGGESLAFAIAAADVETGDGTPAPVESRAGYAVDPARGTWVLPPGRYDLVLRYIADDRRAGVDADAAVDAATAMSVWDDEATGRSLERHIRFWRGMPQARYAGPYREAVARAMLVLKALTYRTNGAIIAAPTTSLPEQVGGSRQWDYRFAWIRDGSYAAEALLAAGDVVSARRFLEFLLDCVDLQGKPFRAPFFHVDGTLIRGERELGWLPGYRDSRPCREGNAATSQLQLDVEGDFLWVVWRYFDETGDRVFLDAYWGQIQVMCDWVAHNWQLPDASLWEFRGRDAHYTHSKLMCWVALSCGARLAHAVGRTSEVIRWEKACREVADEIESHAYHEGAGRYGQSYGSPVVDAALLLMPLYGYCAADNPRFVATLRAIEDALVHDGLVYRYADDMLGAASHPFLIASSWLSRVYARLGDGDRAATLLDGLVGRATDLGLLGEHLDLETGEPRGNFPQAFSHIGVLMAALELAGSDRVADDGMGEAGGGGDRPGGS